MDDTNDTSVFSYSELVVGWKKDEELVKETDYIFVGRINKDDKLHLLGHRPSVCFYMFSERECISLDMGIVTLPEGKSLKDLVKGDIIHVKDKNGESTSFDGATYLRTRN
ncbi:MAG: hypothetical protein KJ767_02260 [Nanoarchaeota archaeon]|nr:hypothetical protein [Nanoarchaeota archaeon]